MSEDLGRQWFVMRDLKRHNALRRSYADLRDQGIEVYTPMQWRVRQKGEKKLRELVPVIPDLLFVCDTKSHLDPLVEKTPTLQYRFARGCRASQPMTVRDEDMRRFISAVADSDEASTRFFAPDEVTDDMLGHAVRVVGGPFDSYEGRLLKVRGSRHRWLMIELPHVLAAAVRIHPDFIQLLD